MHSQFLAGLAIAASTACAVAGSSALIPASSRVAPHPLTPGDGLNAEVWHYAVSTTSNAVSWAQSNPSDGVFGSTLVDYPNGATNVTDVDTDLVEALGIDGASYEGSNSGILAEIFRFSGYIAIPATRTPVQFAVGSDDGMRLNIAGVNVLEYPTDRGFGFSSAVVEFEQDGLYPIELWFYANNVGQSGVEFYSSIPGGPDYGTPFDGGSIVPTAALYRTPEPASIALLALAGLAGLRRR